MGKHTPGPWRLQRGFSDWGLPNQHDIYVGSEENPRQIAGVPSLTPYCMGASSKDRDYAESQWANANLIAAAPAMYEALKLTRTLLISEHGISVYDTNFGHIDDAIAQAEGRDD